MIDLTQTPLASRAWRLMNLYTIRSKDGRNIAFRPNAAQKAFYNREWYFNHILKARQMGFSTFLNIENLDFMLFCPNTCCGIVDNTMDDAKKKLRMIRLAYENLDNGDIHPRTWKMGKLIKTAIKMDAKAEEINFSNGSTIYCDTSLRGGTLQRLHISELGKTAFFTPGKAEEIRSAALNTVAPGMVINVESTHEGGKVGMHYAMLRRAMDLVGQDLTEVDPRFHFYPWFLMPEYAIHKDLPLRPEMKEYFGRLENDHGIKLTYAQKLWYDRKEAQQGFGMLKEFPSTPGEAFNAIIEGAIYGVQVADLRSKGRVTTVPPDASAPMYTAWDIGSSDYTAIWLVQPVGREILWLDHYENNRSHASHYADVVRGWEAKYNRKIALHALPHDSAQSERGSSQSYIDLLSECGITNIVVVPKTHDIWRSINNVRAILPISWFNKATCDKERMDENGEPLPSGVGCLESYHTKRTATGSLSEAPFHDSSSHTADAARTFADAWKLGLLYNPDHVRPVVNHHDVWGRPKKKRPY